jgi:hypothetical protein
MNRAQLTSLMTAMVATMATGAKADVMPAPWTPPSEYSLDMEVKSEGETFLLHRAVSHGRTRSQMELPNGEEVIVLELGDEAGTVYTLLPSQRVGIKQTTATTEALVDELEEERLDSMMEEEGVSEEVAMEPAQIKHMKRQTVDGVDCNLYAITMDGHTACTWNDVETHRPVRMQSEDGRITWKNYRAGAQDEALFQIPAEYQIQDMDVLDEELNAAGMESIAESVPGPGGMNAWGGNGVGLGIAAQLGSGLGAGFDTGLGGALDGTLGAMAAQYLGGTVGDMLGREVSGQPDKQ